MRFSEETLRRVQSNSDQIEYECPYVIGRFRFDYQIVEDYIRWLSFQKRYFDFSTFEIELRGDGPCVEDSRSLAWILYLEENPIGYGRLSFDVDDDIWQTYAAYIALQGVGLYPAVLKWLRKILGPIESQTSLSPGARKAWTRAGGIFKEHPTSGRGYYSINPSRKKKREVAKKREMTRDLNTFEIAEMFDVVPETIRDWVTKGAPVDRISHHHFRFEKNSML
jgi:hypothetical protein